MSINAIWDAIKALAQSLQASTIFPSTVFVLVNAYVLLPIILPGVDNTSTPATAIIAALVLTISYALYAFNFPLIRFLEGYKIKDNPIGQDLKAYQTRNYRSLVGRMENARDSLHAHEESIRDKFIKETNWSPGVGEQEMQKEYSKDLIWIKWKNVLIQLEAEFEEKFPSDAGGVLPTTLGNTIAAFEDYSRTRYGIDSIALWPRFIPALRDAKYLEFVSQEKAVFDFLLNTGFVSAILGMELVYAKVYQGEMANAFFLFGISLTVVSVFYIGLNVAAGQWGSTVRVAFDLYRSVLHKQMNLQSAEGETLEQEFVRWEALSDFLVTRKDNRKFKWFVPIHAVETRGKGKNDKR